MLSLKDWEACREEIKKIGVKLPEFDVAAARAKGIKRPVWVHVGGGNLYRAFHAEIAQDIMDAGKLDCGIEVLETYSPFTIDNVYAPFNSNILQVVMNAGGELQERVLASTAGGCFANPSRPSDFARAQRYFENPNLQLVTFTITEKGYLIPSLEDELAAGPDRAMSTMGIVTGLLYRRYLAGAAPIAMVSTDNFSRNGEKFRNQVLSIADGWRKCGTVTQDFVNYISDETRVSFPWTMIDRITPNPSKEVANYLADQGWSDLPLIDAGRGATFAGFSNTEAAHYLVVEDSFPNGRPPLELGGVIICDRATAEKADTMKVTACLNPLHTCLAVYGCLLGYTRIWQEMENPSLVALIKHIGYDEDMPVVKDPGVIDPKAFIEELINTRLPNRSLPDSPQRIATDTSQKIPIRYGHTIKAYIEAGKNLSSLVYIPLAIAGWLRYLVGIDDSGHPFELSPDPMLDELCSHVSTLQLGTADKMKIHAAVEPILSEESIFGVNLYTAGLGRKVEGYLGELLSGIGAVQRTIDKYA